MKTILITGCSTGFGRAAATHFAKLGWKVFATVRKAADAENLRQEQSAITPIMCDIVDEGQVRALGETVAAQTATLDVLVNNAGSAFAAPMELIPIDVLRAQLDLNLIAQVTVTQAVLPLLKAAKGTIINVSSVGGRIVSPLLGAYCASKFGLEAITEALRLELRPFGVKVTLIEPGSSPTAIWETTLHRAYEMLRARQIDTSAYTPLIETVQARAMQRAKVGFPPQLFADTVEKITRTANPALRYPIPGSIAAVTTVRRLLPDWLWERIVRRQLKW